MLSFKLLYFDFSVKETLTMLTMLVKQYTAKLIMLSENIIDTVKRTCRNFSSFSIQQFLIFTNKNIEYLQVLVVQRTFCQVQINSPVMLPCTFVS